MRIPDQIVDEVARRTDIVELVGGYVSLVRRGARYVGLCPFHQEKTPSFSVNPDMGAYYCFGCQRGGGVFNFVMEIDGLTFPEAVRLLAERAGVEVPEAGQPVDSNRKPLAELYTRVAGTFVHFLGSLPEGRRVLELLTQRGLTPQTVERFGIGYSHPDPFWLHPFLRKKGYSDAFLAESGLFTRGNPARSLFAGRIMFPIRGRRGDVVAFGGRLVEGDGPKYINSPETALFQKREALFAIDLALPEIRGQKEVVVCEGYMDAIALHQSGVSTAVAPLGTAFTPEHGAFLGRMVDSAILIFDADSAGVRATRRAGEILEKEDVLVSVVVLTDGSDPADLLQTGGSRAVLEAVSSPLTIMEFLVRQSLQERSAASPEGKEAVLRDVLPYVSAMNSEVRRHESLTLLADLIGADRDAVRRDFDRVLRSAVKRRDERGADRQGSPRGDAGRFPSPHSGTRAGGAPETDHGSSYDLFLMLAAVRSRQCFPSVRRWVQPEDLDDPAAREIYLALEESYRRGESSLDALLQRITRTDVVELINERLATDEFGDNETQAIEDAVTAIRRRSLVKRRDAVEVELRRIAATGGRGSDAELELLGDKMALDRELEKLKGTGR